MASLLHVKHVNNKDAKEINESKPSESPSAGTNSYQSEADKTCDDLIYLQGPCTEVAIITLLRTRFVNDKLQVFFTNIGSSNVFFNRRLGLDLS